MNRIKREHLRLLLTPSMFSSVVIISTSIFLIVGSVIVSLGKSGHLQNVLFANYARQGIDSSYSSIAKSLDSNRFISQLPLFLFWGFIGLIGYFFAITVFRAAVEVSSLEKSLHYVNSNPHEIIKERLQHLAIRIGSLVVIWLIIDLFFKNLLPFYLSVVRVVTLGFTVLGGLKLAGITLLLLLLGHLLTITIRLAMLKPRAFNY